jgi:hypothetical protein
MFGSILPAGWSFQLSLLDMPDSVIQVGLIR